MRNRDVSKSLSRFGVLRVCLAIALISGVTAMPRTVAAEPDQPLRIVGRLPVLSPVDRVTNGPRGWVVRDAMLVLDPDRRRAYQFFQLDDPGVGIRTFDLDTLRPLAYARLKGRPASLNGEWAYAHDPRSGRFFMHLIRADAVGESNLEIAVLDQGKIERGVDPVIRRIRPPEDHRLLMTGTDSLGIAFSWDAATERGKLLIYLAGHARGHQGVNVPYIAQWDAETGAGDWFIQLQACRGGAGLGTDRSRVPMFRSPDGRNLYTVCTVSGYVAAVVRVPLRDGIPVEDQAEAMQGPSAVTEVWGDPARERVVMISDVSGAGQQAWVFDGRVSRFVGAAGLTQSATQNAYGLDSSTGRLYVLAPDHAVGAVTTGPKVVMIQGGLMTLDTRINPVPQALNLPDLARVGEPAIRIDPPAEGRPRRIFIRRAAGTEMSRPPGDGSNPDGYFRYPDGKFVQVMDEDYYLILEDTRPVAKQGDISDADRWTVDVDQNDETTAAAFDGAGSAYGVRARLVGGMGAVARNSQFEFAENIPLRSDGYISPCWYTEREAISAWSREARLTNLQANAQAVPGSINASTKADLERPSERCETVPKPLQEVWRQVPSPWSTVDSNVGQRWDDHVQDAECVGDSEGQSPSTPGLSGSVTCAEGRGWVEASARAQLDIGAVRVGESHTFLRVERDPSGGYAVAPGQRLDRVVAVSVLAEVRNVVIGEGSIDLIRATARVWSNGRPSDAPRAVHSRIFCGIHAPGQERPGCLTEKEFSEYLPEFNKRVLGQRGQIRLGRPDPELKSGSPKGYVAGIAKWGPDAFNDQLLNGDYQLEVPALEVILYKDSSYFGPGRQIIQLAGVRGLASYGISCLPPLEPGPGRRGCKKPPEQAVIEDVGPNVGPTNAPEPVPSLAPRPQASPPPTFFDKVIQGAREILIRSLGEGLLVASVWLALGLPLFLTSRRFAFGRVFGSSKGATR